MSKRLLVDLSCDWLQAIRLVHSLSEGANVVVIPTHLHERFGPLHERLGMTFEVGETGDLLLSHHTKLLHAEPLTSFGSLSRPLVFPNSMVQTCIDLWQPERRHRFTFAGLVSPERREIIGNWTQRNFHARLPLSVSWTPFDFLPASLRARLDRRPRCSEVRVGDLLLWSSTRGRVFPGKTWDQDYFGMLGRSEFVLCPKGDCVWSYRFYEAILCGAIPIVEETCPAMAGFEFAHMNEEVGSLVWDPEIASHNLRLLIDGFTFKTGEVDAEVERIFRPS